MATSKNVVVVQNPSLQMKHSQVLRGLHEAGAHVSWHSTWASIKRPDSGLDGADVLLAPGACPDFADVIRAAPRLRGVVAVGAGTDGFAQELASRHCIVIGHGAFPENTESMAEATVLLMLSLLYRANATQELMRRGWPAEPTANARMLKGSTVGFVGFGRIASAIAARLSGWDVTIQVHSPRTSPASLPTNVRSISLDDLLQTSDIVTVHVPFTEETRGLLNASKLQSMKRGAILINTSRGGIVDEATVAAMLHDGRLSCAGFDVFETEPLPMQSPLRDAPNVILTPHRLGLTVECLDALAATAIENVNRILLGRAPLYTKNPEVLERWFSRWTQPIPA